MSLPGVSVVFETETEEPSHGIRLSDVMAGWRKQTRADRVLEWIVVAPRLPSPQEQIVMRGMALRWLHRPGLRYYENKNAGILESRGAFVALSDSDVFPETHWLERALDVLESEDAAIAMVTGRSSYAPGPFSRELALVQWPNHADVGSEVSYFLGHNVLLRGEVARQMLFQAPRIRHGPDSELAQRLISAGYRIRYEPSLAMTHNYTSRVIDIWKHSVARGYNETRFRASSGKPARGILRDAIGRFRLLLRYLRERRRPVGIPPWRLPASLVFLMGYCAAIAMGHAKARRGDPEPLEPF